ncbi:MAG: aldehyde dehydrogenase [Oscillospiraceae bacterium]|nr:aldehyde dehydrogenase [Oscillospiraceae bacterium]
MPEFAVISAAKLFYTERGCKMEIENLVQTQHNFFSRNVTKSVAYRAGALSLLHQAIEQNQDMIAAALKHDLNKSGTEAYMAEIGMVLDELRYMRRNLTKFCANKKVHTPLAQFAAKSFISPEPYGVVLVMSPWNYPFMLTLTPVIAAIAAGNCVVVKPSNYSGATSAVIAKLLGDIFEPEYIAVVQGGRAQNAQLLEQRFDYIFFTGSPSVGRLVMEKAARYLTPVTLELGGKSPCIVDETADIKLAAKRIAFGKYLNVGQTCIAPDYLFVHEKVKDQLLGYLKMYITQFYGAQPLQCENLGKIINQKHFERLLGLIAGEKVVAGGQSNAEALQIAPTILDDITPQSPVMQEEIFGPILPVMTFTDLQEVEAYITCHEKPLAFYYFTTSKQNQRRLLQACSFGGGCINDTIVHIATHSMPFGGVGASGMGSYHGKKSFETFTHYRSIVKKANWIDLPMRYLPYTKSKEGMIRMFLK